MLKKFLIGAFSVLSLSTVHYVVNSIDIEPESPDKIHVDEAGGNITNVSDGTWIYWVEPEDMKNMEMPEQVRVELYRVNNALTNEGQRLVSDSLPETVPEKLPTITLNGNEK